MRIDLDAARAARQEATGEGPVVVIGGQELHLPAELPFEAAEALGKLDEEAVKADPTGAASAVSEVLGMLLGDAAEGFRAARPSLEDVMALLDGLVKAYGLEDLGESPASAA